MLNKGVTATAKIWPRTQSKWSYMFSITTPVSTIESRILVQLNHPRSTYTLICCHVALSMTPPCHWEDPIGWIKVDMTVIGLESWNWQPWSLPTPPETLPHAVPLSSVGHASPPPLPQGESNLLCHQNPTLPCLTPITFSHSLYLNLIRTPASVLSSPLTSDQNACSVLSSPLTSAIKDPQ